MQRPLLLAVGVVLILLGTLFTFQGLGYVQGSGMTGSTFWAVMGPIIALVGVAFTVQGIRSGRSRR